jgi:hypothetical protein
MVTTRIFDFSSGISKHACTFLLFVTVFFKPDSQEFTVFLAFFWEGEAGETGESSESGGN